MNAACYTTAGVEIAPNTLTTAQPKLTEPASILFARIRFAKAYVRATKGTVVYLKKKPALTPNGKPCKGFCTAVCGCVAKDTIWKFTVCDECCPAEKADCSICETRQIPKNPFGWHNHCPYRQ